MNEEENRLRDVITELQYYHKLHLESSVEIDRLEKDRDWWAAIAGDYKRDLVEFMRRGPEGVSFRLIADDKWNRIKDFVVAVEKRGTEILELGMTLNARDLLAEMEREEDE